jgi:two-component system NarL family response regulator
MKVHASSGTAGYNNRQSAVRKAPIRIIVAEDHPIVREGIVANLSKQRDMKVVAEGSDGDEALALVKRHIPDVVLLDLRMPRMDGLEVISEISASNLPTKMIVMTTFGNQEDVWRSIEAGVRAYLLKDCSRQTMLETIRRVFDGEVFLLPQIAQKVVEWMQNPQLSPRELQVLRSVASGKSNKETGSQLSISEGTVKSHVASILEKLGVECRTSAIKEAARLGLVSMA